MSDSINVQVITSGLPRISQATDERNCTIYAGSKVRVRTHHLSQNSPLNALSGRHALVLELAKNEEGTELALLAMDNGVTYWVPADNTLDESIDINLKARVFTPYQLQAMAPEQRTHQQEIVADDLYKLQARVSELIGQQSLLDLLKANGVSPR